MAEYLVHDLKVPYDNICLLLSGTSAPPGFASDVASRANILSTLYRHLRDNPKIRSGDNIIFYFAGRGARYSLEGTLNVTDDALDALCPADRGNRAPNEPVLDISDREVSIFLEELRDSKENNITVIFDCCHAFDTIQDREPDAHMRSAPPLPAEKAVEMMLRAADGDPHRKPGSKKAFSDSWDWDTNSCVLLTACLLHEVAREEVAAGEAWRGCFTRALIEELRVREQRTWAQLCEAITQRIGQRSQNPLVVGDKEDNLVWYVQGGGGHDHGRMQTRGHKSVFEFFRHSCIIL